MARRIISVLVLLVGILIVPAAAAAADEDFPFDHELYFETSPLPGPKRVPGIEVARDGRAVIDLWCASGPGQVVIAADTVTVLPGAMQALAEQTCTPERMQADVDILRALTQVTNWRRESDLVVLVGPTPLQLRISTH